MANFVHYSFDLDPEQAVSVVINRAANVHLVTDVNYLKYKRCLPYYSCGGLYSKGCVVIRPYNAGHYHVVIDLGEASGTVQSSAIVVDA